MRIVALVLVLLLIPVASQADILDAPCSKYGIPKKLALAILIQESKGNPWAVNVAGKSYMPKTKSEALSIIHRNKDKSLDIGIMQINSQWLRRFNISPEVAIEPKNNVTIGCWILASCIKQHGYGWKAIGAYHSPKPERQAAYVKLIAKHLTALGRTK